MATLMHKKPGPRPGALLLGSAASLVGLIAGAFFLGLVLRAVWVAFQLGWNLLSWPIP